MAESVLLRDLSVVMVVAAAATILCHRLKQPVVLGYLLAGVLIGPHTPPVAYIRDLHSIHTMAELGLVFLLFSLGLEFNLPRLRQVGPSAALATALEVGGMFAIGYGLAAWFGWAANDRIFLGAILSISSTTIIVKVFMDLRVMTEQFAQLVLGILVLEDVAAVALLTLLSGLGRTGSLEGAAAARALLLVALFVIVFLVIGLAVVPRLIGRVARLRSAETLGIATLGLCLAGALLARAFGLSVALGAFLMGCLIGVSESVERIESWIHPVRDMFSAIFFVATGMLLDPRLMAAYAGPIAVICIVTIFAKAAAGATGSFLAGYSLKTSLQSGLSLAQIGEFSFVFAGLAVATGAGSAFLYPLAVTVAALTTLATPYLIRSAEPIAEAALRISPPWVVGALNRYHRSIARLKDHPASGAGTIFSRYLLRLAVYVALWAGLLMLTARSVDLLGKGGLAAMVWPAVFAVGYPLFLAVAYYANHFFLLALTETMVRLRAAHWLKRIPIHRIYNIGEWTLIGSLTLIWLAYGFADFPAYGVWAGVAAVMGFGAWALRRRYRKAYETLEAFLDHLVGLTTSEPLRLAAFTRKDSETSASDDLMEKILLAPGSPAVQKHLRAVGLREKTGASVIGIYRRGKLIANPKPDTVLLAHDILVILGDPKERAGARAYLKA